MFFSRDTPVRDLTVHLGDYDLTVDNETEHQARKVTRVLFHSHFHPFLLANDIALLQLDQPAKIGTAVRPVCLPSFTGTYCNDVMMMLKKCTLLHLYIIER